MLQESFRQGWKLPSLLVFIVGKGQHTQGLPKLREAVVHLLHGELHMSIIDGAQPTSMSDPSNTMPAAHPPMQHSDLLSTGTGKVCAASSRQLILNPGRLAVQCSSLLLWVRRNRDTKTT